MSSVLKEAPRETLLAALTVSRTFNKAALPLLYSHLYFEPKRTTKRGKVKSDYLRHVKTLDIFHHEHEHCANLDFQHSPDVIRFHWNSTIQYLHGWHGDAPCPLLDLKPKSVVFLDFNATTAPPDAKAFKNVIFPETKNRVVVWDISQDLNNKGWNAAVKNVIFPPEKDDTGFEARIKAINKGKGGEPRADDLTRREIVVFANNSTNRLFGLGFMWWWKSFAKEHARRKHIVVNLEALKPRDAHHIDSIEEDLWKYCANKSEESDLPRDNEDPDKYDNLHLLAINTWDRIKDCRPMLLEYLTEKEIQSLLPPPKMPKAPKAASTKKGKK